MCRLCPGSTPEEIASERRLLTDQVRELRDMALILEDMAWGKLEPHSDKASRLGPKARSLIRFLVENYM